MSMMLPPEMGAPPGMAPAGPEQEEGDPLDQLREALDLIHAYLATENDEEDKLIGEQITTLMQRLLANNQKMMNDALGGKLSPKLMSQAYGG